MSDISKAGSAARTFLRQFQSLTEFAQEVGKIPGLEGQLTALQAQVVQAGKDRDSAQAEQAKAKDGLKKAKADLALAHDEIETTRKGAQQALDDARAAHAQKLATMRHEAETEIAAAKEQLKKLQAQAATELKETKADLEVAREELERVRAAIADLKSKF